jgi:hypothetical protein
MQTIAKELREHADIIAAILGAAILAFAFLVR